MKRVIHQIIAAISAALIFGACSTNIVTPTTLSGLEPSKFDTIVDGKPVALYTLTNSGGMEVCVTNYGMRIVSVMVPDRDGEMQDVVLGFDNIADYMANNIPFGATIGRNANRIRGAKFSIDGVEYNLDANDVGGHSVHGGSEGWHGQIFRVEEFSPNSITMSYLSPDGESGFPGNVNATVSYTLDDENSINIKYQATTDAPTVINLTNHSYFCLSGDPSRSMMNSSILFKSDNYAAKASDNVPTGELKLVDGTPLDFREMKLLERVLVKGADFSEIKGSNGFGVTMTLRNEEGDQEADIVLSNPDSGVVMEVFTSQPSVQFFSCNAYDKTYIGKKGITYNPRNAICLETQHHPNAMNVPEWISPIIRPGELYEHHCSYRFSVDR